MALAVIGLSIGAVERSAVAQPQVLDGCTEDDGDPIPDPDGGADGLQDPPLDADLKLRAPGNSGFNIRATRAILNHNEQNGTIWVGIDVGDNNPFDVDGNRNHASVDPALTSVLDDQGEEAYRVRLFFGSDPTPRVEFTLTAAGLVLPRNPIDPSKLTIESAGLRLGNFRHHIGGLQGPGDSPDLGLEFRISNIANVTDPNEINQVRVDVVSMFTCGGCVSLGEGVSPTIDTSGFVPDLFVTASVSPGQDLTGDGRIDGDDGDAADTIVPLSDGIFDDVIGAVTGAKIFVRYRIENTGPVSIFGIGVNSDTLGDITSSFPFDPDTPGGLAPGRTTFVTFVQTFQPPIELGEDCIRQDRVVATGTTEPGDPVMSDDTVKVVCLTPEIRTVVTVDDDPLLFDPGDLTPRSDTFEIRRRFPLTLNVTIEPQNDPALNGPSDIDGVQLRSAVLEAAGWTPPPPFLLVQEEVQRFTVPVRIQSIEECDALDLLDGVQDGFINFDISATGRFVVREGVPANLTNDGSDPDMLPDVLPFPKDLAGMGTATVHCVLVAPAPSLTPVGLVLLAAALALLLWRGARGAIAG